MSKILGVKFSRGSKEAFVCFDHFVKLSKILGVNYSLKKKKVSKFSGNI